MTASAPPGPDPLLGEPARLSAAEFAVLLADGRARAQDLARVALVEALARDVLRLETVQIKTFRTVHEYRMLVEGPIPDAEVAALLAPARYAHRTAVASTDVEHRRVVTVGNWSAAFARSGGKGGYGRAVVLPSLQARGLVEAVARRWLPGRRTVLTEAGRAAAETARRDVERVRTELEEPDGGWASDPVLAAAAVAALGTLGALVLADPELLRTLVALRSLPAADAHLGGTTPMAGDTPFVGPGYDGVDGLGDAHGSDWWDGIRGLDHHDLGTIDSGTGAGHSSGGDGGWFDGGGSDGGGSDGGGGDGGGGGGD